MRCACGSLMRILVVWLALAGGAQAAQILGMTGRCLDAAGGSAAPGTPVILWPCHGGANQQWTLRDGQIVGIGGMCLDGQSAASGSPVILAACTGTPAQRWVLRDRQIVGIGGLCLDVKGGRPINGTPIVLWSCHGGANQRWSMPADRPGLSTPPPARSPGAGPARP